jgi:hypothetical protein
MKKIFFLGLLFLYGMVVFAQIMSFPFEPGNFDIRITKSRNTDQIKSTNPDESYLAYKNKQNTYEIRLLQYKLINNNFSKNEIDNAFMPYMFMVINNLVIDENAIKNIIPYDQRGVKAENGGDTGFAVFIQYNGRAKSGFFTGYEYVIMNVFLKYNAGIVIKIIMFNDISVMNDENFNTDFNIFTFR